MQRLKKIYNATYLNIIRNSGKQIDLLVKLPSQPDNVELGSVKVLVDKKDWPNIGKFVKDLFVLN